MQVVLDYSGFIRRNNGCTLLESDALVVGPVKNEPNWMADTVVASYRPGTDPRSMLTELVSAAPLAKKLILFQEGASYNAGTYAVCFNRRVGRRQEHVC